MILLPPVLRTFVLAPCFLVNIRSIGELYASVAAKRKR